MSTAYCLPKVAIVILNWNHGEEILACLQSLRQIDYPSVEVIVVDNGSANGAKEVIREHYSEITLIENGHNLGFAGGNNVGIAVAGRRGADYVLLLNDDTEVAPNFLRHLIQIAESDPRIGIAGPKIYYHHRANVIWSAGGAVSVDGIAGHLREGQVDDGAADDIRDVDYVTGCAMLVRRDVVERIGTLDDRFFAYFEETEWCARARRAGYRVVCVTAAHVWHKIEPAARESSPHYTYLMTRNRLLYLRCNHASPWILVRAALQMSRTAASWSIRPKHSARRALSRALVRGIGDFALGRFGAPRFS